MLRTHVPALNGGGGLTCSVQKLPRAPPPLLICSGVSHLASSLLHGWKHLAPQGGTRSRRAASLSTRLGFGLGLGLGL